MNRVPPADNPAVDFLDPDEPVYTASGSGWLDVAGGPARLLGEQGWHLPTPCPLVVSLQWNETGQVVVLDEASLVDEPVIVDFERPLPRGTSDGELARAVERSLRDYPGFPFAHGLSISVSHQIPLFSGLLWREPLTLALHEALGRAFRTHDSVPYRGHAPTGARWYAIDTGYPAPPDSIHGEQVAVAALMAYRMIAEVAGCPVREVRRGLVTIADEQWMGFPLNVPASLWEGSFRHRIPDSMSGEAFLDVYSGINDSRFRVERGASYPLRGAMHYITHEVARARLLRALPPEAWRTAEQLEALGELLYQSHAQAGALGLSVEPADALVSLVMEMGPASGLYGARLTGLGGGGTVAVLGAPGSEGAADELCRRYEEEVGLTPSCMTLGS